MAIISAGSHSGLTSGQKHELRSESNPDAAKR